MGLAIRRAAEPVQIVGTLRRTMAELDPELLL
jgi:hypothetical protein